MPITGIRGTSKPEVSESTARHTAVTSWPGHTVHMSPHRTLLFVARAAYSLYGPSDMHWPGLPAHQCPSQHFSPTYRVLAKHVPSFQVLPFQLQQLQYADQESPRSSG